MALIRARYVYADAAHADAMAKDLSLALSGVGIEAKKELLVHYRSMARGLSEEAKGLKESGAQVTVGGEERIIQEGRAVGYRILADEMAHSEGMDSLKRDVRIALTRYFKAMAAEAEGTVVARYSRLDAFVERELAAGREAVVRCARDRKKKSMPREDYFEKVGEESAPRITAKRLARMIETEEALSVIVKK